MSAENTIDVIFAPVRWVAWILALPLRLLTWVIARCRKPYDPEKAICPGCGYRGEKSGEHRTCRIQCVRTKGPEKLSLESSCFRCSAIFYQPVFRKDVDGWMKVINTPEELKAEKVKEATARQAL